jgi:plastocyanin
MKPYPCKHNQEHKQEQEMQSNKLGYEMGSHKPMNGDTVQWHIESKQNPPNVATATEYKGVRGVQVPWTQP